MGTSPGDGQVDVPWNTGINLRFSDSGTYARGMIGEAEPFDDSGYNDRVEIDFQDGSTFREVGYESPEIMEEPFAHQTGG